MIHQRREKLIKKLSTMSMLEFQYKSSLPSIPCIYFVIGDNDEVLYIGSTKNLMKRWKQHNLSDKMKPHYRIYWTLNTISQKDRDDREVYLIRMMCPTWNIIWKPHISCV